MARYKYHILFILGIITLIVWHNLTNILHNHITFNELLHAPLLDWLSGSAYRILLFITWAGLFASSYNYLEKKTQQREIERAKSATKEAQLQQLMTQLNPHFLFNVLNSLDVAILEKDTETAHQMLVQLSQFLRSTLEHKFDNKIPLKQELKILNGFVKIEQQRFKHNIRFNLQIQTAAEHAYLPPLILQPLIENAIKFSWQLAKECNIELMANVEDRQLNINITNPFMPNKTLPCKGTSTGLENVKTRLKLLYGNEAMLTTHEENDLFSVKLIIS